MYMCDNRFHTKMLADTLDVDSKRFGFIIVDGKGALYARLEGSTKKILNKFNVDLPNKHGRGGQSSNRFAHIRCEKRHNYLRKVAETAVECFIENDSINVSGLILAGSADLKTELGESDLFDQRLKAKILKYVDISYGNEIGLNQAIELGKECIYDLKYVQEKELLIEYFAHIAKSNGLYCFGVNETIKSLEAGCVKTLIIWENLDMVRYSLKSSDNQEKIVYYKQSEPLDKSKLMDSNGVTMKIKDQCLLLDWLIDNYKKYGSNIEIVTDNSQEGSQFCKGFGGIGGILRYQFNVDHDEEFYSIQDEINLEDYY